MHAVVVLKQSKSKVSKTLFNVGQSQKQTTLARVLFTDMYNDISVI